MRARVRSEALKKIQLIDNLSTRTSCSNPKVLGSFSAVLAPSFSAAGVCLLGLVVFAYRDEC